MFTRDVLDFFEGRVTDVAKAIGISRSAVYQWPKFGRVPPEAALKLQLATKGRLKVNPADYAQETRTAPKTARA